LAAKNNHTAEVKRDILWRVYLSYIAIGIVCAVIFGKAVYIQQVQGQSYRSLSDSLHQRIEEIAAERGTIYSEDGEMLSTSIPQFDIYIDFATEALRKNSGKLFRENLDSLAMGLSMLFKDKSASEYKAILNKGYKKKQRYFLFKRKINYREFKELKTLPLVRLGKNRSGFIAEVKSIRLNPYKMMAFRTIGLDRDSFKVGLELTYDSVLSGTTGKRLVRYIGGGVAVPVEDSSLTIEPENGKDVITTLDVHIQEITENALMKMMVGNEAEHGCAIVMEVATGKVKAIANLGKVRDSLYWENFNYALSPTEPGSTFKLATLLALLEDKKVNINTQVDLEKGAWRVFGRTVYDSERHGLNNVSVKTAFEASSNVAMAKLAVEHYNSKPSLFVNHLKLLGFDKTTGIDIKGERSPVLYRPGGKHWSNTTLPWMAFGYNLSITPMHTAMLYNAIANNGKLLKPYLVSAIEKNGILFNQKNPVVINEKIASPQTISQLKACLEGVCSVPGGTGYSLFKNSPYKVAGKTGTALVADGKRGYADHIYQASFAGYFPADDPQYTIVVIIKNKPQAKKYYGGSVAGPVFKEISDRLYTMYVRNGKQRNLQPVPADSTWYQYTSNSADAVQIMSALNIPFNGKKDDFADYVNIVSEKRPSFYNTKFSAAVMPDLSGLKLKDAVMLCEEMQLDVKVKGSGKVSGQSISAGSKTNRNQQITIELN